ncbi:MAG TPA: helix-turn-helix domain-containing protein [Mycobacteriales bacterium]|nr:helix-turn-helix domain-containing protein [Mycobacteriales bacterium]
MRLGTAAVFQLVADYESGASMAELQDSFGLSKSSVSRLLRESGAQLRRQPLGADLVARIVEHYQAGLTIREIGAEMGLPKTTVRDALTRAGVTMRPAARRRKQRPASS